MPIALNHTIVYARDKKASAKFLTDLCGLPAATAWGPFVAVEPVQRGDARLSRRRWRHRAPALLLPRHRAEFDAIFDRITEGGLAHWADPGHRQPSELNTHDGGRGVYFDDPSGHVLEIITQPYGDER